MISPQFVKPFVRYQKKNPNDAAAIVEAGTRPNMNLVPKKSIEQQDIQCLHRIRARLVKKRTALVNQIRGLLSEYGIVMPKYITTVRKQLHSIIVNSENELTVLGRTIIADLYEELIELDKKIAACASRLQHYLINQAGPYTRYKIFFELKNHYSMRYSNESH